MTVMPSLGYDDVAWRVEGHFQAKRPRTILRTPVSLPTAALGKELRRELMNCEGLSGDSQFGSEDDNSEASRRGVALRDLPQVSTGRSGRAGAAGCDVVAELRAAMPTGRTGDAHKTRYRTPRQVLVPGAGDGLVTIAGGRSISYRTFGAPNGAPLLALHGTPGSRLKFVVADPVARELGLRVIAPDRWGYGATTPHPKPSLGTYAEDLAMFANELGLSRFALMGVSGGGPFAAAAASLMPDRISALALVAPVGPIAGESDSEITRFHRLCFGPLAQTPMAIGAVFHTFRAILGLSPDLGMRLAMIRIAAADRRVLSQKEVASRLGDTFVEGLRPGVTGPITDLGLFGAPWGVNLGAARVPSRLWIGSSDQNVPRSAARRLAERLPRCQLIELEGQGHLWIANNYDVVLGWVASCRSQR